MALMMTETEMYESDLSSRYGLALAAIARYPSDTGLMFWASLVEEKRREFYGFDNLD